MGDLRDPRLLYLKGALMLVVGLLAGGLVVTRLPDWPSVGLLLLAIWGFCRAYYFAFYVIQHYVDPEYRFAGLTDFLGYLVRKRPARDGGNHDSP
jgi:hypothetical protein